MQILSPYLEQELEISAFGTTYIFSSGNPVDKCGDYCQAQFDPSSHAMNLSNVHFIR